jgi:hypothetical protein
MAIAVTGQFQEINPKPAGNSYGHGYVSGSLSVIAIDRCLKTSRLHPWQYIGVWKPVRNSYEHRCASKLTIIAVTASFQTPIHDHSCHRPVFRHLSMATAVIGQFLNT